jgi:hypothetical protein
MFWTPVSGLRLIGWSVPQLHVSGFPPWDCSRAICQGDLSPNLTQVSLVFNFRSGAPC